MNTTEILAAMQALVAEAAAERISVSEIARDPGAHRSTVTTFERAGADARKFVLSGRKLIDALNGQPVTDEQMADVQAFLDLYDRANNTERAGKSATFQV